MIATAVLFAFASCTHSPEELVQTEISIQYNTGEATWSPTDPQTLELNKRGVSATGSVPYLIVTSNNYWIIEGASDYDWLEVSPLGGSGTTNVYLTLSENTDLEPRDATIYFVMQNGERFMVPIRQLGRMISEMSKAGVSIDRVRYIMESEPEHDRPGATEPDMSGDIVFEHVSFGYEAGKPIIRDLNFTAKRGQTVAIVGPTGAGKSTIINLLMRFYDPDHGRILLDGVDIRTLRREDLRRNMAMVLQDTWLFNGSIYDNLRYGRLDARRDEVIAAAKMAGVHHFIKTLPGGYDMEINEEGSNISQGEKQLLTIARAILKAPQILILDEATSSVDTRLEKRLQEAMAAVMRVLRPPLPLTICRQQF